MMFYLKSLILITRGGVVSRMMGVALLFMQGLVWDDSLGCAAHASRVHGFLLASSSVHA